MTDREYRKLFLELVKTMNPERKSKNHYVARTLFIPTNKFVEKNIEENERSLLLRRDKDYEGFVTKHRFIELLQCDPLELKLDSKGENNFYKSLSHLVGISKTKKRDNLIIEFHRRVDYLDFNRNISILIKRVDNNVINSFIEGSREWNRGFNYIFESGISFEVSELVSIAIIIAINPNHEAYLRNNDRRIDKLFSETLDEDVIPININLSQIKAVPWDSRIVKNNFDKDSIGFSLYNIYDTASLSEYYRVYIPMEIKGQAIDLNKYWEYEMVIMLKTSNIKMINIGYGYRRENKLHKTTGKWNYKIDNKTEIVIPLEGMINNSKGYSRFVLTSLKLTYKPISHHFDITKSSFGMTIQSINFRRT